MHIQFFRLGLVSNIFRVHFTRPLPPQHAHLQTVVIKCHDPEADVLYTITNSHLNYLAISQWNLGPAVYQIRQNDIVMQYLPGRTLTAKDDQCVPVRRQIAFMLARFHSLNVPIGNCVAQQTNCVLSFQ